MVSSTLNTAIEGRKLGVVHNEDMAILTVFHEDGSSMGVNLSRTDLLAALGAVDAPVEVPKNFGAVVKDDFGTRWVRTNENEWSSDSHRMTGNSPIEKMLARGGVILSQGVEL